MLEEASPLAIYRGDYLSEVKQAFPLYSNSTSIDMTHSL